MDGIGLWKAAVYPNIYINLGKQKRFLTNGNHLMINAERLIKAITTLFGLIVTLKHFSKNIIHGFCLPTTPTHKK